MKYTIEILEPIVRQSYSYSDVVRNLGLKLAGGSINHIKSRIIKFNISTEHFQRTSWMKGRISSHRKKSSDILIILPEGSHRTKSHQLRRALIEEGVKYKCSRCNIDKWQGEEIVLDVDHIDGNWKNNLKDNLRFLCSNCHSLTKNYKARNIK